MDWMLEKARIIKRLPQGAGRFLILVFSVGFIWASITPIRAAENEPLDNGFYAYAGLGASVSMQLAAPSATYIEANAPDLSASDETYLHTEWNLGFIWKRYPQAGRRSMLQLAYRPMQLRLVNGDRQHLYERSAYSLDFLESYAYARGFMPFIGVSINHDVLRFRSSGGPQAAQTFDRAYTHLGFVGGWDIAPSPRSKWLIRSTFRWYPGVGLRPDGGRIEFPNFEYNFFQFLFRFN